MVRLADPLLPSMVAVTGTVPATSAVTMPDEETCARVDPPSDHVGDLPLITAPLASFATAVAWAVLPTNTDDAESDTTTVATTPVGAGAELVTDMLPVFPAADAEIVADPAPTAETSPLPDTVATAEFDVVQVKLVPAIATPCASFAVADAWTVCPTVRLLLLGVTTIDATVAGAVTVNSCMAVTPPLVARILVAPPARPLTTPVAETLRTVPFSDEYVIVRPVRTLFDASYSVTTVCTDWLTAMLDDGVEIVTFATGAAVGALTVSDAEPDVPSLETMIPAGPPPAAVTGRDELTFATVVSRLYQLRTRPVSVLFEASFSVAVACVVWPTLSEGVASETVMFATGASGVGFTDVSTPADFPSTVAVSLVHPDAIAVATPALLTVATVGFALDQVTARPLRTLPFASRACALTLPVLPAVSESEVGFTRTDATGTLVTDADAVAESWPLVAVMVVVPIEIPCSKPDALTLATVGAEEDQVIDCPLITDPFWSSTRAVSCDCWPTRTFGAFGEIEMEVAVAPDTLTEDRKSTRLNSSHSQISYAVFCLK